MDRLKNPSAWIGFLVVALGAAQQSGLVAVGGTGYKVLALAIVVLGAAGSWFFGAGLSKPAAAAILPALALILLPTLAHADTSADPGTQLAGPVAPQADPAPVVLTPSQQAACVAERSALAIPEAIAACTSSKPPAPMDTRTFVSVLVSGSVTALQSLVGTLVLALSPTPLGK